MAEVDELVAAIDARGVPWDIYKEKTGFRISFNDKRFGRAEVAADNLTDTLKRAATVNLIPLIPRCPALLGWRVEKSSTGWRVFGGESSYALLPTRAKAEATKEVLSGNNKRDIDEWWRQHGSLVEQGTEGVDYTYELLVGRS